MLMLAVRAMWDAFLLVLIGLFGGISLVAWSVITYGIVTGRL